MGKKSNFKVIRGIVLQQEEQTIIMKNQINRYKEALKKAQEKSKETWENGIKEDSESLIEQIPQEPLIDGRNLRTQTKSSNENKQNTESFIEIVKRKFRNYFFPTN